LNLSEENETMNEKQQSQKFADTLEEHSAEGIDILTGISSPMAHGIVYILIALLTALFIWSFYGKAEVIVTVPGQLDANSEMRRIYPPAPGELIDIYATEGIPVSEGDLLARIKSSGAIQAASEADQAKLRLEKAELDKKLFPQKKQLMEKEIENITQQTDQKQKEYEHLKTERFRNLPAAQKHKLEKISLKLKEAEKNKDAAKETVEKYNRLYETPGHGGISEKEMEEKEMEYLKAETAWQDLRIDLENLEVEFSKQMSQAGKEIGDAYIEILNLRFQHDAKTMQMENEEKQVSMQYRAARAAYEAASVVTFDDLDEDNFLKIRAPVSGIITYISFKQRGEKVRAETPLFAIAPANAEKVLRIDIPDKDRGLLRIGQSVKLKFAAFPYQQYGFIKGILEYISPNTELTKDGEAFYKGRIGLAKDYFTIEDRKTELKYGMTAKAEIVVQERRLIQWIVGRGL
jgi:HlyD family secretion protein